MKEILQDLSFEELESLVLSLGEKKYRAAQLWRGLMQGKKISDITDLSKAFKSKLLERFEDEPVRIAETLTSSDGTEKYLFALADGNVIEGVFMRYKYGNTQCVSTQVGCRMNCAFCASGLGGLVRDLTAGEILSQILVVNALHGGTPEKRAVTNVVLMGSGEPLDNYDNTVRFLRNVSREGGIGISPRNISLSTCGIVPKMYDLAEEGLPHRAHQATANPRYYAMWEDYVTRLTQYGVRVASQGELQRLMGAPGPAVPAAEPVHVPEPAAICEEDRSGNEPFCGLLSAEEARRLARTCGGTLRLAPGAVLTPLARDVLREKKITLVTEEGSPC